MPTRLTQRQIAGLNKEIVLGMTSSARFLSFIGQMIQGLPRYSDDVERDFGPDIYRRMLNDATLGSALRAIQVMVLSEGVRVLPGVKQPSEFSDNPDAQTQYDRAVEIAAFVEDCLNHLQQPIKAILKDCLGHMAYGHSLAEQVYTPDGGRLRLTTLRVKQRAAYWFVVDKFMNIHGVVPVSATSTGTTQGQAIVDTGAIVPREKFMILSFSPEGGDPRGSSLLRPAYNPWFFSQNIFPEWFKFIKQFATPSTAMEMPENVGEVEQFSSSGEAITDESGSVEYLAPEEAMVAKLINFQNGSAITYPHGGKIDLLESNGNGEAYIGALDYFDRQKTKAVLLAIRAVMEAKNSSRADSETAQDLLNDFVQDVRGDVETAFQQDVIRPLVLYNYGKEAAEELCPKLSLSGSPKEDRAEIMGGIAGLARASYLHTSQYPEIDAMLGLPERDMDAMQAEAEADRAAEADRRQMLSGFAPALPDDSVE